VQTESPVVVKGFVTKVEASSFDPQFGSLIYYIADTKGGKTTLEVYRGMSFGGAKFASASDLKVDDEVVLSGVLTNYNGTKEVKQGSSLLSVNGVQGESVNPDTPGTVAPAGKGTEADPYNVAAISEKVAAMAKDVNSEEVYYIKGKVKEIKSISTQYGNAEFTLTDDGNNSFTIFRALDFNKQKFTSESAFKVDDEVVVCGKVVNYKGNTPETVANEAWLVSINGKTAHEGGTPTTPDTPSTSEAVKVEGKTVTLTNSAVTAGETTVTIDLNTLGLANAADATSATLTDGTVVTFGGGTNEKSTPKFYTATKGVRLYANNTITIEGKQKIAKIVMTCDAHNGTNYVGNATATVVFDGNKATYTNVYSENAGGVQLRVQTITITYAK
jgi:hypothetical protein